MITFTDREAGLVVVGDLMRQADEHKRHTVFYHYRAATVFRGDKHTPIYDLSNEYIGDRIERDVVIIDWTPIETGPLFSMTYHPQALVEVATIPVADASELLTREEYGEDL